MIQIGEEKAQSKQNHFFKTKKASLAGGWRLAVLLCLCQQGDMGLDRRQR